MKQEDIDRRIAETHAAISKELGFDYALPSRDELMARLKKGRAELSVLFQTPAWAMTQAQSDRVERLNRELNALGQWLDGERQ